MKNSKEIQRLTNRHIAKTLDAIDAISVVPQTVKAIFMDGMNNLSRDIETNSLGAENGNFR